MSELEVFKQADWVEPHNRFVFWSGGKDSTVALHLALRAWRDLNPRVVFVDTEITLPETLEYVERLTEEWHLNLTVLKPTIDFWDYVAKNGFPLRMALWCRGLLKMQPIKKFMKAHPGWKVQVLGIRKNESVARQKSTFYRKSFVRCDRISFTYELNPILEWSDKQVNEYINQVQIPVNPAYSIYGRSGCYYCPFVCNRNYYLKLKRLHPELFGKIVEAETVMRKGHASLYSNHPIYMKEIGKQEFLEVENHGK